MTTKTVAGTFYIHDNYGRPFQVNVMDETKKWAFEFAEKRRLGQRIASPERYKVQVYASDNYDEDRDMVLYSNEVCFEIVDAKRVFIGESPLNAMTRFSGGHGPDFYGNTILVERANNTYVWIGDCIKEFSVIYCPIVEFVSPVGNNDVPYPWARDSAGNTYLMIEDVILDKSCVWEDDENDCPYQYYYNHATMTKDLGRVPAREPPHPYFQGISGVRVGAESYTLRYHPNAKEEYEWLQSWNEGNVIFEFQDGSVRLISQQDYVSTMEAYGKERGFRSFSTRILVPCK